MDTQRRRFLVRTLCGAGLLGLRSLGSGLPTSFLAAPLCASAQDSALTRPQFLIFNTSQEGDPINTNCPGTYQHADILHPRDPRLQKTDLTIGGATYGAAAPWATLGQLQRAKGVFDRMSFIHHSTETEQHLHEPDVLGLMGNVVDKDMLVSAYAALLAPALGTIQPQPITIGTTDSSESISFRGKPQPLLSPRALATVLGAPDGPLGMLSSLRDSDLDRMHALLKQRGSAAQRQMLDRYALSRAQTRKLSTDLLDQLAAIRDDGPDAQMAAAIILVRMKVAPVITVHIPFGADNHFDGDLQKEADQTVTGVASIARLLEGLAEVNLSDQVTFASLNVFGRTLLRKDSGRSHNRNHHVTLLIGSHVRGSVIGGIAPKNGDYGARPISSKSGKPADDGDISPADSLASVGKTLGAALGLSRTHVDQTVVDPSSNQTVGKLIPAALRTPV